MPQAQLQFYGSLNYFLPENRKNIGFTHVFEGAPSIKDMIESLGVPHPEVVVIVANGQPVSFQYHVQDGDTFAVYPSCELANVSSEYSVCPPFPAEIRFVADVHVGRLAAYLRMMGFDTLYPDDYRDEELARLSSVEDRVLLTRDLGLLKRSIVNYGYYVRETDPWRQLSEVLRRFNLLDPMVRAHRCTACNAPLVTVDKAAVADRISQQTSQYYEEYQLCLDCGKIYWRGSHFEQLDSFLKTLRSESR